VTGNWRTNIIENGRPALGPSTGDAVEAEANGRARSVHDKILREVAENDANAAARNFA
jgi:hypothetical protein